MHCKSWTEKKARVCKPCKGILERLDLAEQQPEGAVGGAVAAPPPAGVLKRSESGNPGESNKQVMFSDGIRPGGDLAELDGSGDQHRPPRRSGRGKKHKHRRSDGEDVGKSLIPATGLPYVSGQGPADPAVLIQNFQDGFSVPFSLNRNLRIYVTLIKCCKYFCPILFLVIISETSSQILR